MNKKILLCVLAISSFAPAQVLKFIPSRPAPEMPDTTIQGYRPRAASDTVHDLSLWNTGSSALVMDSLNVRLDHQGKLNGEWQLDIYVGKVFGASAFPHAVRGKSYVREAFGFYTWGMGSQTPDSVIIKAKDTVWFGVNSFTDCEEPCAKDSGIYLFTRNTAAPVDTFPARIGLFWKDSVTRIRDSVFLDCKIEYNESKKGFLPNGVLVYSPRSFRPQTVPGGWLVPAGDVWVLNDLRGRSLPLSRENTAQGELLKAPSGSGMAILRSRRGVFRVLLRR